MNDFCLLFRSEDVPYVQLVTLSPESAHSLLANRFFAPGVTFPWQEQENKVVSVFRMEPAPQAGLGCHSFSAPRRNHCAAQGTHPLLPVPVDVRAGSDSGHSHLPSQPRASGPKCRNSHFCHWSPWPPLCSGPVHLSWKRHAGCYSRSQLLAFLQACGPRLWAPMKANIESRRNLACFMANESLRRICLLPKPIPLVKFIFLKVTHMVGMPGQYAWFFVCLFVFFKNHHCICIYLGHTLQKQLVWRTSLGLKFYFLFRSMVLVL